MREVYLNQEGREFIIGTPADHYFQEQFAEAFGTTGGELEEKGLTVEDLKEMRADYFDEWGYRTAGDFDWDAWRDAIESLYEEH